MKIRRINLKDGNYVKIGDFVTVEHETDRTKDKEYLVTLIQEGAARDVNTENSGLFGFTLHHKDILLSWIPFHAVTMVFFEVENES